MISLFFEMLQVTVGTREKLSMLPSIHNWETIFNQAGSQAILGIMLDGLERLPQDQLPPKSLKLRWIGLVQNIEQRNMHLNNAVINLCHYTESKGIHIIVFKGQTLAALYPMPLLRQSGDIDYYVQREDWHIAVDDLEQRNRCGTITNYIDYTTEKDIQYESGDIAYEMHKTMVSLASPSHRRYWDTVVMPDIISHPWTVSINGYEVPTLAPTYNILYVFVHIFEHLILDGIGLRQFCDLFYLLKTYDLSKADCIILKTHLDGLGLSSAFTKVCAVLIDYLGLPEKYVPIPVTERDHNEGKALMKNIICRGNFGHNVSYRSKSETFHGIEHLGRVLAQSFKFVSFAPSEVLWRVPYMFQWRCKRFLRGLKK